MSVTASQLEEFVGFAERTVRLAGAATLPYFRSSVHVENKLQDGFDPVTEADKAVETIIRDALTAAYPSHGVLGEEFGHQSGNGLTWVIDPIDGTRAFMSGMLHWGVLLGLFDGVDPVVGAMYQPYVDECFVGDGRQAWFSRAGERRFLQTSSCDEVSMATLATTDPRYFNGADLAGFHSLQHHARQTRLGGDCYVHAMVAMGTVDLGTDATLNPYDIQALIPIIRGAGGVVTTYDGGNPALGGTVLASANDTLHRQALDLLSAESKE